jgi:CRP-like cAMP-binding protein
MAYDQAPFAFAPEPMTRTSFLQRLQPATRDLLTQHAEEQRWSRRECIFRKGDVSTGVHLLTGGLVKLYRSSSSGREQIVLLEGAGSVLSLVPLFDEGTHSLSAEALKPATALFVLSDVFMQLHEQHRDLRAAVTSELARRLRLAQGLLETIALQPVTTRVAVRLLELAAAHAALDGSRTFRLLLSQDEMARMLGTSRESVARALGELRAHGVIEQRGSRIRVTDAQALFEWSHLSNSGPVTPLPAQL